MSLNFINGNRMNESGDSTEEKFVPMLERIREMFLEFGAKNLNMDEISRKLGISKKTLYRYVDSKESLIRKIFENENDKWTAFSEHLAELQLNAIEKLFEVSRRVHEEMRNFNPMLVFELRKYYEHLFNEYMTGKRYFIQKKMRKNLEQGMLEGLYRSDLNIDLVVTLYVNGLVEMHNYTISKMNNATFDQVFEVMFEHHIRAISTPEGVAYFEKRKKEIIDNLNKEQ